MSGKAQALSVTELLAKNPAAASIFKKNRKKLEKVQKRSSARPKRKEYSLGLPYERLLVAATSVPSEKGQFRKVSK